MELNKGQIARTKKFLLDIGVKNIETDYVRKIGRGNKKNDSQNGINELCGKCTDGGICITSSGDAYPCVFSRFWNLGNIKDGIQNIFYNSSFKEFRKAIKENDVIESKDKIDITPDNLERSNCLLHYS